MTHQVAKRGTKNGNQSQRVLTNDDEWQQMTTSRSTSDKEWYNGRQRVTANDNKWQRVTTTGHFG